MIQIGRPEHRHLVGTFRELPVPEMEALLLASRQVSEASMRELALQRGVAVRDHLVIGQIPVEPAVSRRGQGGRRG